MSDAWAASVLDWWADAGVDCLVEERPRDWLSRSAAAGAAAAPIGMPAAPSPAPAMPAPLAAELPGQLDLFRSFLADHPDLPFAAPGTPRICPAGDPAAGLMIMIGMPFADDVAGGALLSGAAGRLFDRMLAAIGRDRASVYLTSLSCIRAPGGLGDPAELARCAGLARHHVGLAAPRALLLMGDEASRALLGLASGEARGRWHGIETGAGPVNALATMSPETLLGSPALKRHAWADLLLLMEGLEA
jgi:uracil-DNA glycosylase